ncbi:MAG: oligosaccharide flippase family protein [Anaerolineae bacterium]|nr:oligosaccharide flippase family protein [Anaerolineae bacterium]
MSPNKRLSLRVNFTWAFVGNLIYAACQWGMVTVLAKLGSAQKVGQYSIGLAVTAPVIMFADLQLRAVQATDAQERYTFTDYLGLRLVMTLMAVLVIGGILVASDYSAETSGVIFALGLAKAFEAMSDIIYGVLQKHERLDRMATSLVLRGILSVIVLALVFWLTHSVLWASIGVALSWLLVMVFYDIRSARQLEPFRLVVRKEALWALAKHSLPLGIVMMLISLNSNIPRYIIERRWGEDVLGYFSASAYLMVVGSMVVRAMGQSAAFRLSKYAADRDTRAFSLLLGKLVGIGALLGSAAVVVASVLGRWVLTFLYRSDYADYVGLLVWVMVAAGLGYIASFLGYGMTALHRFKEQVPLFILVVLSTTVACAFFIPAFGVMGAAYGMVISASVNLIGSLWVNIRGVRQITREKALDVE